MCLLSAGASGEPQEFTRVAISYEQAGGYPSGIRWSGFSYVQLDDLGNVSFKCQIWTGNDGDGVVALRSGQFELLAREGDQVPGLPAGVLYDSVRPIARSSTGRLLLDADLSGSGVTPDNDQAVIVNDAGGSSVLMRTGDTPPGITIGTFESIGALSLSSQSLVFAAEYLTNPSPLLEGIWSGAAAPVTPVALDREPADGLGPDVFYSLRFSRPLIDSSGRIAFKADLFGPGARHPSFDNAIFQTASGTPQASFRWGDSAPCVAGVLDRLSPPVMDDAGNLAFSGTISGASVSSDNNACLWSQPQGVPTCLVAREGEPAAGTGVVYESFTPLGMTESGRLVFRGRVRGPGVTSANRDCVWIDRGGTISLIARDGDSAPGAGPGAVFQNIDDVVMNRAGQVAFFADLGGAGVTSANDESIWVTDVLGNLRLLVRSGDTIDVNQGIGPPDERTIRGLRFTNGGSHFTGFNSLGQIAFVAEFTDFTEGVFITGASLDSDGDGLLDAWETEGGGLDVNNDGIIDLDLYALGARPDRLDLFVEVDAMAGFAPEPGVKMMLEKAFREAPVTACGNPGIELHLSPSDPASMIDEDDIQPEHLWIPTSLAKWSPDFDAIKDEHFGTEAERMHANSEHILEAKRRVFRYALFARTYGLDPTGVLASDSSGLAERPGDDFLVSLGHPAWLDVFAQQGNAYKAQVEAGTFMHELGHTLGLKHGGDQGGGGEGEQDDMQFNYKPNYYSVMNHLWQYPWARNVGWRLDYSHGNLITLDENNLNELAGVGGTDWRVRFAFGMDPIQLIGSHIAPIDWDKSFDAGTGVGVSADINRIGPSYPASLDVLTDFDDWSNLRFRLDGHPNYEDGVHAETTFGTELSYSSLASMGAFDPVCMGDVTTTGSTAGGPGYLLPDGQANLTDLLHFVVEWEPSLGPCTTCFADITTTGAQAGSVEEITPDGTVDLSDLLRFVDMWLVGRAECP